MNPAKTISIGTVLGIATFLTMFAGAQTPGEKILFLNLIWENGNIRLQDYAIRPGRLKQGLKSKPSSQALVYELFAANNARLGEGFLPNPSLERLEYADPARPGAIKPVPAKRDTATFTLRLPYNKDLFRVDFFDLKTPLPQSLKTTPEAVKALKGAKISSIDLKLEEVK